MNEPKTFIFAGRSGCGKGTQLKLLREFLSTLDPDGKQFAFATGDGFREFFNRGTYTSERAKELTARGELQPLFLTTWLWANEFIEKYEPGMHVFIDGYPRVLEEAVAVDSMLKFYDRKDIIVLNFQVSRETSKERMLARGRADDTPDNAETRLDWYDEKVTPAIEYFRGCEGYTFIDINGEQPIEPIHQDIITKLGLTK